MSPAKAGPAGFVIHPGTGGIVQVNGVAVHIKQRNVVFKVPAEQVHHIGTPRRLEGTGVTVNCLHPGFVATNFGRSNGGIFQPIFRIGQLFATSPEEGAQTSVYLASSPEVADVSGKYFDRKKPAASSNVSNDHEAAARLRAASLKMTGLQENEVPTRPAV